MRSGQISVYNLHEPVKNIKNFYFDQDLPSAMVLNKKGTILGIGFGEGMKLSIDTGKYLKRFFKNNKKELKT